MFLEEINKIKRERNGFYIKNFYYSVLWDKGLGWFEIIEKIYFLKNEFRFKIGVKFMSIRRKDDIFIYNKNHKWFFNNMLNFFTEEEIKRIKNEINERI